MGRILSFKDLEESGFGNLASLQRLGRYPNPLYLTTGEANTHLLHIRLECALADLGDVCANATALLRQSTTVNDAAGHSAFSCNCANACHNKISNKKNR